MHARCIALPNLLIPSRSAILVWEHPSRWESDRDSQVWCAN
jgi:hypothetical protein